MWSKIKSAFNVILICSVLVCFLCCANSDNKAERVIGKSKTIVYNGCRYVPQDGLSCWMWSNEGMTYVGKYKSLALFNNTVSNIYAPISYESDPRLYVDSFSSGNIRWIKEGFEFPSPLEADIKYYVIRMAGNSISGDINSIADIIETDEGILGDGLSFKGNVELHPNGYGDTYYSGRLYTNKDLVYFHDEGYSELYYPVKDSRITDFIVG